MWFLNVEVLMMQKKLFVLSIDALVREDVAYLESKPNFKKIMDKRAEVEKVCSVYPASTYPAHTTLATGCYPGKHGICTNVFPNPFYDGINHWPLYAKHVYAEDLFAAAKRAGCTTAAVYWPITACNPNIDHVINEYFFYYPGEMQQPEAVFAAQGADETALQAVRENLHLMPTTRGAVELMLTSVFDSFLMGCTCSLIRNAQPDLLMVHNCYLDSTRHRYGVFGEKTFQALDQMDQWLGDVIRAMEDAGVYEQTNFVIVSDHGQMDYTRRVKINVLLRQAGFAELAINGETLYEWEAFAMSSGKSATVYLRDNTNRKLYDKVYACLQQLQAEPKYGIERIFTQKELAERYGQCGSYSFMLEAEEDTSFDGAWIGDEIVELGTHRGSHGYMPEKGPQPVFMAHGPDFREGAALKNAKLVDVAPTLAAVLGRSLPEADGRVMTELLK